MGGTLARQIAHFAAFSSRLSGVLTREYFVLHCIVWLLFFLFFLEEMKGTPDHCIIQSLSTKPQCHQTEGLSIGQLAPVRPQQALFVLGAQRKEDRLLASTKAPFSLSVVPPFASFYSGDSVRG